VSMATRKRKCSDCGTYTATKMKRCAACRAARAEAKAGILPASALSRPGSALAASMPSGRPVPQLALVEPPRERAEPSPRGEGGTAVANPRRRLGRRSVDAEIMLPAVPPLGTCSRCGHVVPVDTDRHSRGYGKLRPHYQDGRPAWSPWTAGVCGGVTPVETQERRPAPPRQEPLRAVCPMCGQVVRARGSVAEVHDVDGVRCGGSLYPVKWTRETRR